MRGQQNIKT